MTTKLEKCEKAFKQLKEFVSEETQVEEHLKKTVKTASIKAFEYTYETFWQLFQHIGKSQGAVEITNPRKSFIFAYAEGLIENQQVWLDIINSRNNTSHTYNEKVVDEIFEKIRDVYQHEFEKALNNVKKKFSGIT